MFYLFSFSGGGSFFLASRIASDLTSFLFSKMVHCSKTKAEIDTDPDKAEARKKAQKECLIEIKTTCADRARAKAAKIFFPRLLILTLSNFSISFLKKMLPTSQYS